MAPSPVAVPNVLSDPGYLFIAPLGTAVPTNTVAGSVFTDAWAAAWIPLGATTEGSTFSYSTNVEPITVAEFFDPIRYATTERGGSIAFALANWGLSNYRRALNGGVAALTATSGTGATALYNVSPPTPGSETRAMIGWESLDNTLRLVCYQTIQGEISTQWQKAPEIASIPCTYNLEMPTAGKPFDIWGAEGLRVRNIGSFGVEYAEADEQGFAYFGTDVRINPEFGELDLADFMEAANSLDENSVESLSLLKNTMRAAVHAEDFDAFWSTAKRNRQGIADLMPILYAVVEAVSDRPTERPSDSSGGPQRTRLSSVVDSSSQVIARLEGNGRPDLANMAHLASQASVASA